MYTSDEYCICNAGKWCAHDYIADYDLTEDKMGVYVQEQRRVYIYIEMIDETWDHDGAHGE